MLNRNSRRHCGAPLCDIRRKVKDVRMGLQEKVRLRDALASKNIPIVLGKRTEKQSEEIFSF